MKIRSISVGKPKPVQWQGQEVLTSIFKTPLIGPAELGMKCIFGDEASDKRVHGTVDKAVYAYSFEAYKWWRANSNFKPALDAGEFGENLTLTSLHENEICIGDIYGVGSAELIATGPRLPCFKLGIKFGDIRIVNEFLKAPYPGVYFQTLRPGRMQIGDELRLNRRAQSKISVLTLYQIYQNRSVDPELARETLACPALPESWKKKIAQFLTTN